MWIGTDTQIANGIVEKILQESLFDCFDGYNTIKKEVTIVPGTRIDFLLTGNKGECFIEVKSATVVKDSTARYPDSITPRGLKHIEVLTKKALEGKRAIQIFIVQRNDAKDFAINESCFPAYTEAFQKALLAGVEVLVIAVSISPKGIRYPRILPIKKCALDNKCLATPAPKL